MAITRIKLATSLDGDAIIGTQLGPTAGCYIGGQSIALARRDLNETIIEISTDGGATFPGSRTGNKVTNGVSPSLKRRTTDNHITSFVGFGTTQVRSDIFDIDAGTWTTDFDALAPLNTSDSPDQLSHVYTPGGAFHMVYFDNLGTNPIYYIVGTTETEILADDATYGSWGGERPGLVVDGEGNRHVFFKATASADRSNLDTIYHMYYNGSSWGTPTAVKTDVSDHHVLSGEFLPVMDSSMNVHLAILANDSGGSVRPYMCSWNGSSWSNEVIDSDFIENNSADIITAVDRQGTLYVMVVGETTAQTTPAVSQPYIFKKLSGGSWEQTLLEESNFDITGAVRGVMHMAGDTGDLPFMGTMFLFRGDWDSNGTDEDFVVNADLSIEEQELVEDIEDPVFPQLDLTVPEPVPPTGIPISNGRVLEKPEGLAPMAKDEREAEIFRYLDKHLGQFYEYMRIVPDSLRKDLVRTHEGQPGDRRNVYTFFSPGAASEEVALSHGLGYRPESFSVVKIGGPGHVYNSRDTLSDVENVYLRTTAPRGVEITVRVW